MRTLLLATALALAALVWEETAGTSAACVCSGPWCGRPRTCSPAVAAVADAHVRPPAAQPSAATISAGFTLGLASALSLVALFWKSPS